MIRARDLPYQLVPVPCKIVSSPVPVQCRSVRPDIDGLSHFSCEPLGITARILTLLILTLCSGLFLLTYLDTSEFETARSSVFGELCELNK